MLRLAIPAMPNRPSIAHLALALALAAAAVPASAQTVRSAAGDLATVTAARDLFRADLGGGTDSSGGGLFGGVRREINWDGASDDLSAPNGFPRDFFNLNSARGVVFETAGTGFAVSAKTGNPTATEVDFGNLDPEHTSRFVAFSPQRLFASLGNPGYSVHFLVPGTNQAAVTTGFGAVFTDVDGPGSSIEYFDASGQSLGKFDVPAAAGDETFSFLGVSFPGPAQVARVEVIAGEQAIDSGADESEGDFAVVDDFLYGNPVARAQDACVVTPTALCLNENRFRVEGAFDSPTTGPGIARGFAITADSGVLSFFRDTNLEQLIKVLNGCGVNGHYWVYGATASNVETTLTVTDTANGTVKTFFKPFGPPAPALVDSSAFATCP